MLESRRLAGSLTPDEGNGRDTLERYSKLWRVSPASWLNDDVKGFLSSRHEIITAGRPQFANLRLSAPVPASRIEGLFEETEP